MLQPEMSFRQIHRGKPSDNRLLTLYPVTCVITMLVSTFQPALLTHGEVCISRLCCYSWSVTGVLISFFSLSLSTFVLVYPSDHSVRYCEICRPGITVFLYLSPHISTSWHLVVACSDLATGCNLVVVKLQEGHGIAIVGRKARCLGFAVSHVMLKKIAQLNSSLASLSLSPPPLFLSTLETPINASLTCLLPLRILGSVSVQQIKITSSYSYHRQLVICGIRARNMRYVAPCDTSDIGKQTSQSLISSSAILPALGAHSPFPLKGLSAILCVTRGRLPATRVTQHRWDYVPQVLHPTRVKIGDAANKCVALIENLLESPRSNFVHHAKLPTRAIREAKIYAVTTWM